VPPQADVAGMGYFVVQAAAVGLAAEGQGVAYAERAIPEGLGQALEEKEDPAMGDEFPEIPRFELAHFGAEM